MDFYNQQKTTAMNFYNRQTTAANNFYNRGTPEFLQLKEDVKKSITTHYDYKIAHNRSSIDNNPGVYFENQKETRDEDEKVQSENDNMKRKKKFLNGIVNVCRTKEGLLKNIEKYTKDIDLKKDILSKINNPSTPSTLSVGVGGGGNTNKNRRNKRKSVRQKKKSRGSIRRKNTTTKRRTRGRY